MKQLSELLSDVSVIHIAGSKEIPISSLHLHANEVESGGLFFALPGAVTDGHLFIPEAIKRGAKAIVCEQLPSEIDESVTYVQVEQSRKALSYIASAFFDHPSREVKLVGVTGTNGKTTIATLLYQIFELLGYRAGLLSTIDVRVHDSVTESKLTTLDPITLNRKLKEMVAQKCTHVFMEVSSHALVQQRVAGLEFVGGVFSNITHDHLDYHKTFDAYLKAKQQFFDMLHAHAFALANGDSQYGEFMLQNTKAAQYFYGLNTEADFRGTIEKNDITGLTLEIAGERISSQLIGAFNAYNMLAAYGAAVLLQEDPERVRAVLPSLVPVRGRFEWLQADDGTIGIIDYAHTPDAVENVLQTVNDIAFDDRSVVTVIGCGGDRDKTKRPVMARIAYEHSSTVIFTADNPRSEDPLAIIEDMKRGIAPYDPKRVFVIPSREEAIEAAVDLASPGGIVAVLGKGHETYQEIDGVRHPFDDRVILKRALG